MSEGGGNIGEGMGKGEDEMAPAETFFPIIFAASSGKSKHTCIEV